MGETRRLWWSNASLIYFKPAELACPCCGAQGMQPSTLIMLESLRAAYGKPITLSSAYRCEKHNTKIGGAVGSAHMHGWAVDIPCYGGAAIEILKAGLDAGFTGLEVRQHLRDRFDRWIHFDNAPYPHWPRPGLF